MCPRNCTWTAPHVHPRHHIDHIDVELGVLIALSALACAAGIIGLRAIPRATGAAS